jgi:hypothetical protein
MPQDQLEIKERREQMLVALAAANEAAAWLIRRRLERKRAIDTEPAGPDPVAAE